MNSLNLLQVIVEVRTRLGRYCFGIESELWTWFFEFDRRWARPVLALVESSFGEPALIFGPGLAD